MSSIVDLSKKKTIANIEINLFLTLTSFINKVFYNKQIAIH